MMIPKSTANINKGDFCWIKRDDNKQTPFIFLCKQGNSRSYFYGGLTSTLLCKPNISELPKEIEIVEYALLHIKCFQQNDTPLVGNIKPTNLQQIKQAIDSTGIGTKISVWGHKTLIKYANSINT